MSESTDSDFRLPAHLAKLIGRGPEIDAICGLLGEGGLVTVTGPPGIGKTRVAMEVARRVARNYPTPPVLVELAHTADPALVGQSAAFAFGLHPQPGRDPLDSLVAELGAASVLLLLDNCEHVLGASAELVTRLLAECNNLSVLATSQVPLGVRGEEVVLMPPLSVPDAATVSPESAVAESEAVALFCARAAAINHEFVLTEELVPSVIEICRHLDGIPLAIELAAARSDVMGVGDIAERLGQRFNVLTKGNPTAPARHQTLRAAIDWSYNLLGKDEATLLPRLSVFAGGASPAAIRDVGSGDGVSPKKTDALVASLVSRSLVTVTGDSRRAPPRYQILETIRAYGRQRLTEAGELRGVSSRHALWCTQRAEELAGSERRDWVQELEVDHENLRAALRWSIQYDSALALRLAVTLVPFWQMRGYFKEGQDWLTRALRKASRVPPELQAEGLAGLGLLAIVRGEIDQARRAVAKSLAIARAAKLVREEEIALNLSAFISIFTQEPLVAKPLLERALRRIRKTGGPETLAASLSMFGRACLFLGDIEEARRVYEECLSVSADNPAAALFGLGWTELAAGDDNLSQERFEAALPLLREVGERFQAALALSFLGELAWARGEIAEARALLEEGLEEARAMGAPYPAARCLCHLANVTWAEGDVAEARRLAEEACELAATAHLPYAAVRCLGVRGRLKWAADDPQGARADFDEALAAATTNGDRQGQAQAMRHLAGWARATGDHDKAVQLLHQAIEIEAAIGGGLASSLEELAAVEVERGQAVLGARLFAAARALRKSGGPHRRPDEAARHKAGLASLRSRLKGAPLKSARAEGSKLSRSEAVRLALEGELPHHSAPLASDLWKALTPSEQRIVEMSANGMSSRQIAHELGIAPRTVQGHVGRALSKLHLESRRELRGLTLDPEVTSPDK